MMLRSTFLSLALVAGLTACGAADEIDDVTTGAKPLNVEQTVAVPEAAAKLVLNNTFGAITVIGEEGRTEIKMTPSLKTGGADDGVILVAPRDGDSEMIVQVSSTSGETIAVDVTVYTPKALDFVVNTSGGNLNLSGMTGNGTANTGDGDCTIDMDLGTEGDLTVVTAQGDVSITVPATTEGSVTAAAIGGTVTVDGDLNFTGTNLVGNASGNINGGGEVDITVNTNGGNIALNGK
jgi:hypothetical protein